MVLKHVRFSGYRLAIVVGNNKLRSQWLRVVMRLRSESFLNENLDFLV